jgi:hypothetical protein
MPQSAESPGDGVGIVVGVMEDVDENGDDSRGVQFPRNGNGGELLPLSPLLRGATRFGAEVNVGVLEWFSFQLTRTHQETQSVVHAQMQEVLEFGVGLACR